MHKKTPFQTFRTTLDDIQSSKHFSMAHAQRLQYLDDPQKAQHRDVKAKVADIRGPRLWSMEKKQTASRQQSPTITYSFLQPEWPEWRMSWRIGLLEWKGEETWNRGRHGLQV